MNDEKILRIFLAISAGIHIVLLFSLINYTLPSAPAQFLEVNLIEMGEVNKPPGPGEELPPAQEPQPLMPQDFEKEEIVEPMPTTQSAQTSSSPAPTIAPQVEVTGGGGGRDEAIIAYLLMIKKRIEERKKYPRNAIEKGEEGEVYLKFKILPDGNVKDIAIIKSSGFPSLDEDSMELIKSVAPLFPPPRNYALSIKIPIKYEINR